MNSIWITGDTHGDFERFYSFFFPEQQRMDKSDVMIICGDFGGIWSQEADERERVALDFLNSLPFTVVYVDGNHENYDRYGSTEFPVEERFGAPVQIIRDSVYHLLRGYVYTINGKKIFAFGGAACHDVSDGIINLHEDEPDWQSVARRWVSEGRWMFRVNHVSWWKEEVEQDPAVYERGIRNLKECGNKVDYIVTHCCATSVIRENGYDEANRLTDYLEEIRQTVRYDRWFFGHYHETREFGPKEQCLYEEIRKVCGE